MHNVAVEGSFDDCQDIVKACFSDAEFKEKFQLGAINSINWARILAQTLLMNDIVSALRRGTIELEEASLQIVKLINEREKPEHHIVKLVVSACGFLTAGTGGRFLNIS